MTSRSTICSYIRLLQRGHSSWRDRFLPEFKELAIVTGDRELVDWIQSNCDTNIDENISTWYPDDTIDDKFNSILKKMLQARSK